MAGLDRATQERLSKIGQCIPKSLLKRGLIKDQSLGAFERDVVAQLLKDPGVTLAEKKMLRRAVAEMDKLAAKGKGVNTADRVTESQDPKVAAEIDRIVGAKVAREIRAGRLKRPDPNDPFLKMIREKSKYAR